MDGEWILIHFIKRIRFVKRSQMTIRQYIEGRPMILKLTAGILLAYIAYCSFLFVMQRQILFPRGQVNAVPVPDPPKGGVERVWLDAGRSKVEAWYLPVQLPPGRTRSPAVIFAHGNGELIDFWPDELMPLTRMGIGVLLVEYPGYGRSTGTPSQASIERTFVAAYDYLTHRRDIDAGRVVLFGRSLGGGAVCRLAARRPSAALILMSAFVGVRAFAARFMAPGFLIRDPFDNLAVVRSYPAPVLVIHGRTDDVIPYDHGRRLAAAAPDARMVSYDCGHNDCPPEWGPFWEELLSFLTDAGVLHE